MNWEEYIENLKKVIFYSKGKYCPGCGITPEALEQAIFQEKEKWEAEQGYIIKILSSLLTPDQRTEALSQLYKQGIDKTINLLQK